MKTYFAKSILVSKTFWVNMAIILAAIVDDPQTRDLFPEFIRDNLIAIAAVINIILRVYTVRPVAFVSPNDVKAIAVPNAEGTPKPA